MAPGALEQRAWGETYARLSAADQSAALACDDLELLATAAYLTGRDAESTDALSRAHNESLRAGDAPRAARCAFWIALTSFVRRDVAQASGWLARARRLLDDGRHNCAECGLVLMLEARIHLARGDFALAEKLSKQAAAIGDRLGDPEVSAFSLLVLGQTRAKQGKLADALALFDEVMVAATAGDVSPIAIGVLYCAVIEGCYHVFDLTRVREWTAALSRWCDAQSDLIPFRGQCLVHRAEITLLTGDWPKASQEAQRACKLLELVKQSGPQTDASRPSFPIGAAFYQLGEVHRVRGEYQQAHEAYREANGYGESPQPGLALLRLAQGQINPAVVAIRGALAEPSNRFKRASLLGAATEILLAARDAPAARSAADELATMTAQFDAALLQAVTAAALGSVLLAEGDAQRALDALRVAWMMWQEIDAPYEAARVRVAMALARRALGDDEAAELELDAAQRVFQRLQAGPELARVRGLFGRDSGDDRLTPRELHVIKLVAAGRSNRAIAAELGISDRTVDRHVSNILMKLGLSSRSAATAYAFQQGLV